MNEVRFGIVGCGGMGASHMKALGVKDIQRARLTAVADTVQANLDKAHADYGVKTFSSAEAMYDSGEVDAVVIATPHYFHPPLAIAAFERNIHVLTEKPTAVTAKAAQQMNDAAAKKPKLKFQVMYQNRSLPRFQKAKEIISTGRIGELQRVTWVVTNWFRTQFYYNSGGWRATWKGEGGGVLLNQCPHNLDILCWLTGMPTKVYAQIALGKTHKIEVEDEVNALLEYKNGAVGHFITTTGELPGVDRLEIIGDRGGMVMTGESPDIINLKTLDGNVREFVYASDQKFGKLKATEEIIETPKGGGHKVLIQNLTNAILDGEALIAPATEGIMSVELANAMIMSGIQKRAIDMPMDRDGYERLLKELIEKSTAGKAKATV